MKRCSTCREHKAIESYSKNCRTVDGLKNICKPCSAIMEREWRLKNVDRRREVKRKYYLINKESIKAKSSTREVKDRSNMMAKKRRALNPEKFRIESKKDRIKYAATIKIGIAKWKKNNPSALSALNAKRHAIKLNAMLKDDNGKVLFSKEIRKFYDLASKTKDSLGTKYQVDHVIPLINPDICGLHVPWNLQLLSAYDNNSKNNKFDFTYYNNGWRNLF